MNWMKHKFLYFALSLLVILPGLYSLTRFGLNLSVDFRGGSTLQFQTQPVDSDRVAALAGEVAPVSSARLNSDSSVSLLMGAIDQSQVTQIEEKLKNNFDSVAQISFLTVGPSVSADMIRQTLIGIALATGAILFFVARAFRSLKFGLAAVIAMLHDSLVLIGTFALLGHFFGAPTDLLFVTAVLTVLSFSVHDTIVVYDRIRELQRRHRSLTLTEVADKAITETLIRSLNNSLTIIFMLLALILLGGQSTRWFAVALLIGTITGTYSSPFTAVPLLVVFDNLISRRQR